jgi:hypothetical protein
MHLCITIQIGQQDKKTFHRIGGISSVGFMKKKTAVLSTLAHRRTWRNKGFLNPSETKLGE